MADARAQIEADIEQLRRAAAIGGDTAALTQAEGQLQGLSNLQRRIEHAGPGALTAIRAEVVAFVAASQATAQLVRTASATAQAVEAALHLAQAEARRTVADFTHDFYERKMFEGDLKFASPEDERAYREREEQFRREIEKARAEGTPDGDLRALQLAKAQLLDAGAHGADRNPNYAPMLRNVTAAEAALKSHVAPTEAKIEAVAQQQRLDVQSPDVSLDPALIAQIQGTGMIVAEADAPAHGVAEKPRTSNRQVGRNS